MILKVDCTEHSLRSKCKVRKWKHVIWYFSLWAAWPAPTRIFSPQVGRAWEWGWDCIPFQLVWVTILLTHDHSSLGTDGSENVALQESHVRRILQGLKRWCSLKHYMLIVGLKAKPLRRQRPRLFEDKGKCSRKEKALGRQMSVEGKGPWIACVSGSIQALSLTRRLALGWQSTFEHKGPWNAKALGRQRPLEGKDPPNVKILWRQRPFDGKGPSKAKGLRWQRLFEHKGKGPWKTNALGRQMRLIGRQRPFEGKSKDRWCLNYFEFVLE